MPRPKLGNYLKCETCSKEFYVSLARIKHTKKQNNIIRYCSHKCYKKDGKNNPFYGGKHSIQTINKLKNHPNRPKFKTGVDNPNFLRFAENTFIGITRGWWKKRLLKEIGKCEGCGWFEHKEILEIHHLDRNSKNNTRENLKLFCPNCHEWWHYKNKSGKYHGLKGFYKNK